MFIIPLCRPDVFVSPIKRIANPKNKHPFPIFYRDEYNCNDIFTNRSYSIKSAVSGHKFSELKPESPKLDNNDDLYASVGLKKEAMPKHIAFALDGNRRWLKAHGHELSYKLFFDKFLFIADLCLKWGVPKFTAFVWGLSNFNKRSEVNELIFGEFGTFLRDNQEHFNRNGMKLKVMGERSLLSKSLEDTIKQLEDSTRNNSNLEFSLLICYTGQRDITNATRKICEKVKQGLIEPSDITEDTIQNELTIPSHPVPDLFIRTGGEYRVGALLTWQVSHVELYFSDLLSLDFEEDVFIDALRSFQQRRRLFGK